VMRSVAFGIVCLAGLCAIAAVGAIAAAAKKSIPVPSPELVFPVTAGIKSDRLPVSTTWETLTNVDTAQIAYAPLSESGQPTVQSPLVETADPPHPDFASRHRHDTHDLEATPRTRTNSMNRQKKRPPDGSSDHVSQTSDCHSDGLRPLLDRLKLSPPCGS